MRRAGVALVVLSASLALAGCSQDPPPREPGPTSSGSASPSDSSSPSASPSASSAVPSEAPSSSAPATEPSVTASSFTANTREDTEEPSGFGGLTVTDVRLARQDGFDRVVFELDGPGDAQPGWVVSYTDDPRTAGQGASVNLPGKATLQVILRGTGYPDDTGVAPFDGGPGPLTSDTELVTAVSYYGTFEGQDDAFVGVVEQLPFRVYKLDDPRRVVLEVRR